ncbi:G-type lectin S-receptor-like serine/threonine-protein kinase B120 [Platanthera guangdongensis]|uniref:G-type lectin S-receptor-like serine/threonine-protein kinase B120 n=1 Tax=Platanthera guangdongensis TaxID=2320717 RepID=A0ABR2MR54_9ASPA
MRLAGGKGPTARFFPIGSAGHRYVGIWHRNFSIQTIVWLANRENPIPNRFGSLAIHSDGNLAVLDGRRRVLWSSNTTLPSTKSIVELSDFGNLMLNNSGAIAWESFDHPSDTYLAGMKIGLDLSTNSNQLLSSWKSPDDPSPGRFSLGVNPSAQLFIWEDGRPRWRSGQWNGQVFIGIPDMVFAAAYGFKLSISIEGSKIYYSTDFNSSHRWVLSPNGTVKHLLYFETSKIWLNFWEAPASECEQYNRCGNYGICTDGASTICSCLKGFMPRSETEWSDGNWSEGCTRKTPLQCEGSGMKPDLFYLMQDVAVSGKKKKEKRLAALISVIIVAAALEFSS